MSTDTPGALRPSLDCGSCSMCCRLMSVDDMDPPKVAGVWCTHCAPTTDKPCTIYESRPTSCRTFKCFWLHSQSQPEMQLPPDLRPDRCKVVLAITDGQVLAAHVHPDHPQAINAPKVKSLLGTFHKNGVEIGVVRAGQTFRLKART